jgi:hypothetical protein
MPSGRPPISPAENCCEQEQKMGIQKYVPSQTLSKRAEPKLSIRFFLGKIAGAALALSFVVSLSAQDSAFTHYISFDAPTGTAKSVGTFPVAINRHGWIAGSAVDASGKSHGFLRRRNGVFILVDAPFGENTWLTAINANNEVVGYFDTPNCLCGFLRDAAGNYTQIAVPGSDITLPSAINGTGVVVGYEIDGSGLHAFLWSVQNGFTIFDVPGSIPNTSTPWGINGTGTIAGSYYDAPVTGARNFIRSRGGRFTTFEAIDGQTQTQATAINASGQITGSAGDNQSQEAFLRNPDGTIIVFAPEGATQTTATAINDSGEIVGYVTSPSCCDSAFERDQLGNVDYLTLPFDNVGVHAVGINLIGNITGWYIETGDKYHGWVRVPGKAPPESHGR